jgi:hypothetical protein
MDYINNKGEKIGSLDTAISNDKSVTIHRNDHQRPRPRHGRGVVRDVLR